MSAAGIQDSRAGPEASQTSEARVREHVKMMLRKLAARLAEKRRG